MFHILDLNMNTVYVVPYPISVLVIFIGSALTSRIEFKSPVTFFCSENEQIQL